MKTDKLSDAVLKCTLEETVTSSRRSGKLEPTEYFPVEKHVGKALLFSFWAIQATCLNKIVVG